MKAMGYKCMEFGLVVHHQPRIRDCVADLFVY